MDKEKLKVWLSSRDNQFLLLLLIFAAIIGLFYFFKVGEQPIWWDEGDYLAVAKVWAQGQATPEWWSHFTGMRPLLMPLIWTLFFKIGFSELLIRFFTLLLPFFLIIYLTYLLGKDLYSKKAGVIAAFMMSVYWVFLFYSLRLLTDIPSVFFGMLCLYFFWSVYITKEKSHGLYLSILFGVLAFSARFPLALILISCAFYLLAVRKFSLFKDKTIWKSILVLIICFLPYLIYFIATKFYVFSFYFGESAVSIKQSIAFSILPSLFSYLYTFWQIALVLGLFSLFPLIIGFDIFWNQKDKSLNSDFFVLLFLIIHLLFYVVIIRAANDRWLLMLMPMIFILSAKGILFVYEFIKKYSKIIGIVFVLVLVLGGAYQNLSYADKLINFKKDSYLEIKDSGLWFKENTPEDTKIITASIVQNQYYSERQSYDFHTNDTIWKNCTDIYGAVLLTDYCQSETEVVFNKKVEEIKPDYFVISVFEQTFTPQWALDYPQRYNLTFVKAYKDAQNQPMLVIYKF